MRANYKLQRLYVDAVALPGADMPLAKAQAHYLLHVLRLKSGDSLLLFDGKNGEWRARCVETGKKSLTLRVEEQTRPQPAPQPPLIYCFAPLKQARLDYMVQKAVEMGAARLQPTITQHSQISRLNIQRIEANAIEAAEQCGLLTLAECAAPLPLPALLAGWRQQWGKAAKLIFCDEAQIAQGGSAAAAAEHTASNPLPLLQNIKKASAGTGGARPAIGLIIGPEGGFSAAERRLLYAQDFVAAIPLGSRILRADTAAVAALAVVQSVLGDW